MKLISKYFNKSYKNLKVSSLVLSGEDILSNDNNASSSSSSSSSINGYKEVSNHLSVISELPEVEREEDFDSIYDYRDSIESVSLGKFIERIEEKEDGGGSYKNSLRKNSVFSSVLYNEMIQHNIMSYDNELKVFYVSDSKTMNDLIKYDKSVPIDEIEKILYGEIKEIPLKTKQRYFTKLFDRYILYVPKGKLEYIEGEYESLFYGLLLPKGISKDASINKMIDEAKSKTYKVDILSGITDNIVSEDGTPFKFSMEDLKRIETLERSQGYDFDTTALKLIMGLQYFTPYQLYILENWGNYDDFYLTATRRAGKSYFMTYLAIRQIFLKNETVIYLVPTEDAFEQPMMYVQRFLSEIEKYDKNIKIMSDGSLHNKIMNSVLWFKSAASRMGVRSKEATLGIMDEASFIPDNEASSLMTMLEQVRSIRDINNENSIAQSFRGKLLSGTTINPKMPKNWYYDDVRSAESGINTEGVSIRVGIYQCPFYTDQRREKLIQKLSVNPDRLKCELMAEFPSANEKYSLDNILIRGMKTESLETIKIDEVNGISLKLYPEKSNLIMSPEERNRYNVYCTLGYDPAKKSSNSAMVVSEVYVPKNVRGDDFSKSKVVNIGEGVIPKNISFMYQVEALSKIYLLLCERYNGRNNVHIGIDSTGVGEVVSEMIKNKGVPHYKLQYVRSGESYSMNSQTQEMQRFYFNKNGIYYIKRDFLLDLPITMSAMRRFNMFLLPSTYSDFEVYNDETSYDPKKHTIDFYHASCLSIMAGVLSQPEIYFYTEDSNQRRATLEYRTALQQHLAHLNAAGFVMSDSPSIKGRGEFPERYSKFGY